LSVRKNNNNLREFSGCVIENKKKKKREKD